MQAAGRRSVVNRVLGLAVATVLVAGVLGTAPSVGAEPPETFVVGAASRSINPNRTELNAGVYLGGYGVGPSRKAAIEQVDDLRARALVVGVGDQRMVLVTLDLVGMGNLWMRAVRNEVAAATGISARAVMVHVSHSHGAPDFQGIWGGVPAGYRQRVVNQAVAASVAAVETQDAAELRVASAVVPELHNNRRGKPTKDDALSVLQFTRPGGEVVATLVNYAAHPTNDPAGDNRLSTDFVGPVIDALEPTFGSGVGFFVNGTLGDLSPAAPPATGGDPRTSSQRLGEAIAARAIAALDGDSTLIPAGMSTAAGSVTFNPGGTLLSALISVPPTVSPLNGYYDLANIGSPPRITANLLTVRLGTPDAFVTLATFPGEPLSSTGIQMRNELGGVASFLFATTNESLGYLLPSGEWTPGEYEEGVSLERLAGDKTVAALRELFAELSPIPLADFTDIAPGAFFARGVDWVAANGLTQGAGGARTFQPRQNMNRAQMALFLWRLMGEPEPESEPCGFTDTASRPADVRAATCWMKEQGITTGINDEGTLYGPSGPVTRGQMGAFMFRLAGGTQESGACGFTDAPRNPEFARASCWLKEFGITTGTNAAGTQFTPLGTVTRGQMATFLYRLTLATDAWGNPLPPLTQGD